MMPQQRRPAGRTNRAVDRDPMRRILVLLIAVLTTGCVNQLAARQAQLQPLVGRPETELIQVMGVPNRTYETGGVKFLAYEDRQVEVVPGSPFYYGPAPFPGFYGGGFYGGGFPPTAVNLICDTTFAVAGGLVQSFTLRGNACG
jgi:hypothetical protein